VSGKRPCDYSFFRIIGVYFGIIINFMIAGVGVLSLIAGVGVWSFILHEACSQLIEFFMIAGVGARYHLHDSFSQLIVHS